MFDKIRHFQQQRMLRQMLGFARKKRIDSFGNLGTIGIVFTVGSEQEWNALYHFTKEQERAGKQVWLAGYQAANTTISYIFTHSQTTICHEKEDFSFLGIPKTNVLDAFLQQHYDLLLDLTAPNDFFGKYTSLKALANLKATHIATNQPSDPDKEQIFDLIIRPPKPLGYDGLFDAIIKYLNMVKK